MTDDRERAQDPHDIAEEGLDKIIEGDEQKGRRMIDEAKKRDPKAVEDLARGSRTRSANKPNATSTRNKQRHGAGGMPDQPANRHAGAALIMISTCQRRCSAGGATCDKHCYFVSPNPRAWADYMTQSGHCSAAAARSRECRNDSWKR